MDPNATWELLVVALIEHDHERAREYAEALAEWLLVKQGFTPKIGHNLGLLLRWAIRAHDQRAVVDTDAALMTLLEAVFPGSDVATPPAEASVAILREIRSLRSGGGEVEQQLNARIAELEDHLAEAETREAEASASAASYAAIHARNEIVEQLLEHLSPRTQELAERLVAEGSFPQISASEGHELSQAILGTIKLVRSHG